MRSKREVMERMEDIKEKIKLTHNKELKGAYLYTLQALGWVLDD